MLCSASWLRVAAALQAAALVGACSIADSTHVEPSRIQAAAYVPAAPTLCASTLGSYALPKSFLRVHVRRAGDAKPELVTPVTVVRADKSLTFCLDHIVDPLADDEIRVVKSSGQSAEQTEVGKKQVLNQYLDKDRPDDKLKGNKDYGSQLLQWVVSNTVDQSERIAKTLIRTAFVAISGNPGFVPLGRENPAVAAAPVTVAFFEYDPFDAAASALHNQRLRELGYCLVLEGFTFDRRRMSAQQYCSAPRHESSAFDEAYATYRAGPPPQVSGIAYRPRIQYPLLVYRNDNAPGRGTWRLERQYSIGFENIAPIVSIGLTRSLFAARRVALKFNMGALEAMCLVKTSELQGAVMVPYEIVRSIIALPTAVFEVKIGNIGDNIDLLGAEAKVVRAQMEYLDFLADQTKDAVKSPLPKKEEVPLPGIPDPTARPAKIAIVDSVSARLSELDSGVLKQICSDAPSVLTLAPRKPGGMP